MENRTSVLKTEPESHADRSENAPHSLGTSVQLERTEALRPLDTPTEIASTSVMRGMSGTCVMQVDSLEAAGTEPAHGVVHDPEEHGVISKEAESKTFAQQASKSIGVCCNWAILHIHATHTFVN